MSISPSDYRTITVTPEHVVQLDESPIGSLLIWHEATGEISVTRPHDLPGPESMIICGYHTLAEHSQDCPDEDVRASTLTNFAGSALYEWPRIKAFTAAASDLRTEMARRDYYLLDRPRLREDQREYFFTDVYQHMLRPELIIEVATAFMNTSPASVQFQHALGGCEVLQLKLGVEGPRPGVASTVISGAVDSVLNAVPVLL